MGTEDGHVIVVSLEKADAGRERLQVIKIGKRRLETSNKNEIRLQK